MLLYGVRPEPSPSEANGGANEDADTPMATADDLDTGGDADAYAPQRRACAELGAVMMALLPALDANDSSKTQAAISLYLSVLSNCVAFTGSQDLPVEGGSGVLELGLSAEDFVVGFLQRVFQVIGNLELPGGAADGTSGGRCAADAS